MILILSRVLGKHKYQNSTVPTNSIHHSLTPAKPLHEMSQEASRSNLHGIGKHGHAQKKDHAWHTGTEEATTEEGTGGRGGQDS